jgi:PAS domain S-box-containing protein
MADAAPPIDDGARVPAPQPATGMSKLQRTLWAVVLALLAATLIVNTVLSYWNTRALADGTRASAHSREVVAALNDLHATIASAEAGQRGYLLTRRNAYLAPYEAARRTLAPKLERLRALLAGNTAQLARVAALEPLIDAKLAELERSVALIESGDAAAALQIVATDSGVQAMATIRTQVDSMRMAELSLQSRRDASAAEMYRESQRVLISGMIVGIGMVALAMVLLYREMRLRERAAAEIAGQREWFSTTLRSIGDAVIVTDPAGRVQLLNPVAERLTGWSAAEAAGRLLPEIFEIFDERTRAPARDPVARAITEGRVIGLANHTVLRARDGSERVIEDSAAPTYDAAGAIQGAIMVFHDATARRSADAALRRSSEELARRTEAAEFAERTLKTILDNAPIGICMTGEAPDYRIVAISREMRDWIGAAVDMPAYDAYHKLLPDGSTPADELLPLHRVMQHGDTVRDERWLIERKGKPPLNVLVNVAPVRDGRGRIVGAVHSWVDLSEREYLDHALRVTRARLGVLVDANVIGLMLSFDGNGRVSQANDTFLAMLGFDRDDLAAGAVNLRVLTPPAYAAADERAFAEIAASGACAPYEKEFWVKSGDRRIAVMVAYAQVAGGDEYVGFALDLSERKELEHRLRDQAEKLLLADRRKDEFLAMLGHELRNPLAPLRNAVHLLESSRGAEPGFVASMVPAMRRQIEHLVRLVDDLLDAARISQSKIRLERSVVELAPLLHAAAETVQALVQARGQTLHLALADAPLRVEGDSLRLVQLFSNILHNAAKYTPAGGRIDLSLMRDGGDAVVRVRDTGQGIAAALLPRIFETFVQDDQSLARSAGGLGVGLALVRRLAELHGGSVQAFSEGPDRGSEFVVRLPLTTAPARSAAIAMQAHAAPQSGAGLRVLVVDDNVDLAQSTATLLDLWGHEVGVVHNGQDVLFKAPAFAPDVILLDIGLPGMDGFEVARRIRATPELADVRLVAVTGYGQDDDRARTVHAGFDAHLTKPVQPEVLRELLASGPAARTADAVPDS